MASNQSTKKSFWQRFKWWFLGLLAVVFMLFSLFVPLPYYVEMPGGAFDIKSVLTVNGKEDHKKGSYNFVAVGVSQATLAQLLYALATPDAVIETEQTMTGGYSNDDYIRINRFYMESSQNTAIYQALKLAGKEVTMEYKGVYVLNVAHNSTFRKVLQIADTVTAVNGKTFKNSKELIDYVAGLQLGDEVTIGYTSDGKHKTAKGSIIELSNGKHGIGIGLTDHTEVNSSIKVKFSTDGFGGPSAGLMFTLAIYDQVSGDDLRAGRVIAGTGTIEPDGSIGDIGGAGLKVISAAQAGAKIFFVPNNPVDKAVKKKDPTAKTNYEEAKQAAKRIGTDMKIVPVTTLKEAIDYLKKTK
ncbi:SepM family pheromone-processing serine protease [Streptococcus sciuri]|uniref:PDZ domain-containing protein n=1 Tax=Streptococcus sciuri TaxID=2973939 RepID=A0ABT2F6M9_9STRE|nr:SepM family pheromone-processing serine protease [Streptococcus sciuri]MCS4488118.1 PDZ domain-containing protein [Streptococcus sciuri]